MKVAVAWMRLHPYDDLVVLRRYRRQQLAIVSAILPATVSHHQRQQTGGASSMSPCRQITTPSEKPGVATYSATVVGAGFAKSSNRLRARSIDSGNAYFITFGGSSPFLRSHGLFLQFDGGITRCRLVGSGVARETPGTVRA